MLYKDQNWVFRLLRLLGNCPVWLCLDMTQKVGIWSIPIQAPTINLLFYWLSFSLLFTTLLPTSIVIPHTLSLTIIYLFCYSSIFHSLSLFLLTLYHILLTYITLSFPCVSFVFLITFLTENKHIYSSLSLSFSPCLHSFHSLIPIIFILSFSSFTFSLWFSFRYHFFS